jgi:hypothetical protein
MENLPENVRKHLKEYLRLLIVMQSFPSQYSTFDGTETINELKAILGDDWMLPPIINETGIDF